MIEPVPSVDYVEPPDVSQLVTEDGAPVESIFQERQMRLLTESLYATWNANGRPFAAFADVGIFYGIHDPPIVPDVFVSLDVKIPANVQEKRHRSYMLWEYGKPPDVAIEVVSNRMGGEEEKLDVYARVGVPYVAIFDPFTLLSPLVLRLWQRHGNVYVEMVPTQPIPSVGLGFTLWTGIYEGMEATWLRWNDESGRLLPTGVEEHERAEAERQRADEAEARTERLIARLRELGADEAP